MSHLVIAIDCDDVLVASTATMIEQYNKEYGTSVTLHTAHDQGPKQWKADDKQTVINRLTEIQGAKKAEPLKDAVAVLSELAVSHDLHMITARPVELEMVTLELAENDFGGLFVAIEHVGHEGSKGEACMRIQADILIDDNLRHLQDAAKYGIKTRIWFGDYPWQKQVLPEGIVRCRTWKDVDEYLSGAEL